MTGGGAAGDSVMTEDCVVCLSCGVLRETVRPFRIEVPSRYLFMKAAHCGWEGDSVSTLVDNILRTLFISDAMLGLPHVTTCVAYWY